MLEKDVLGLEVAVHLAVNVEVVEAVEDLHGETAQWGVGAAYELGEVSAVAELHHDEGIPLEEAGIGGMHQVAAGYAPGPVFHVEALYEGLAYG